MASDVVRLGLIGDNIARSQSPRLHVLAGKLCGIEVTYERLVPTEMGRSFEEVLELCRSSGYRGINVTYPYKERVTKLLSVPDSAIAAIGACNTILFGGGMPVGHNTDYTGFKAAFLEVMGNSSPGRVAMAGGGGVGKAVAFGLAGLGCDELVIYDKSAERVAPLLDALREAGFKIMARAAASIEEAVDGVDGLVNCTPLGMVGYPGSAIPAALIGGKRWAFDAVYTPVNTAFLDDCRAAGLELISGYQLFFHQGVDAFRLFTGLGVNQSTLRRNLAVPESD